MPGTVGCTSQSIGFTAAGFMGAKSYQGRGSGTTRLRGPVGAADSNFLENNPMLLHKILKKITYYLNYTRRYTHLVGTVGHGMAPKRGSRRKNRCRKQGENRVA